MRIAASMPPKSPKPATTEPNTPWIPTEAQIAAAENKTLDDVIGFNLDILFCGINPSLYSAAIGKHYGRPQNRFWRALHESGLTDRLVSPFDERY